MIHKFVSFSLVVACCVVCLPVTVKAQPPGGRGGSAVEAAKQNAQSRLQSQIQQRSQTQAQQNMRERADVRMQTRVQAQLQAQLQSRLSTRFSQRPQAELQNAAEIASRAATALEFHGYQGRDRIKAEPEAQQPVAGNASRATREAIVNTQLDADGRLVLDQEAMAMLPPGFARANDAALQAIFGEFDAVISVERQVTTTRETPVEFGSLVIDENTVGLENEQPSDKIAKRATDSASRRGRGVGSREADNDAGRLSDMEPRIAQAVRQRRAQISKLRDTAVSNGNTELLSRADQLELMLEAFVEARQIRVASQFNDVSGETSLQR